MSIKDNIESIKSVNIRPIDSKRRLLMSSAKVDIYQSFLMESIASEVLIINTNIGMEVYYYSKMDYGKFIKESVLLYTIDEIDVTKLKFRYHLNQQQVYDSFCDALLVFSRYPQIFLAYSKKFIHLKDKNETSKFIVPLLYEYFENILKILAKTGKVPHFDKIERAKKKSLKPCLDSKLIQKLISEVLLKRHRN